MHLHIALESGHPRVRNLCGELSLASFATGVGSIFSTEMGMASAALALSDTSTRGPP